MVNEYRFRSEDLKEYIGRFLTHFNVPREDASIVGDALITADLRGVHSHGIGPVSYTHLTLPTKRIV